ncbi:MAG: GNAT family N-acetyltransferase, partial [Chloroflexia bacterium]|nr:GNAT family N-acetyltransferase [Chloroflexia bacterium]
MADASDQPSGIVTLETADLAAAERVHRAIHGDAEDWDGLLRHNPVWSAAGVHRAVRRDGELVSLASLATTEQRFGGTTCKVGEIGLVGTLPEHRRQGHSRALMESWLTTMRAEGYALAYLFGIRDFYERWAFHYAAPDHIYPYLTVERRMLDEAGGGGGGGEGVRVRALDIEADLAGVMALANEDHAGLPCSPVRSEATWRYLTGFADRHGVDWLGVEDVDGALIGYARVKRWAKGSSAHPPGAVTDVAVAG